jgi:excisionase family DNA binding protein
MTIQEAAEQIGRKYSTVAGWLRDGKLKGQFVPHGKGGYWNIRRADLLKFVPPVMGRPKTKS